ncbi:MAG: response regulator [Candidatus Eisenbacteria bacterium]
MAAKIFSSSGYVTTDVPSAEDALDLFEKQSGNFDLVFSDVMLPGKNGVELADELLTRKPDLKILLTSGHLDDRAQWSIVCDKGLKFLHKPFTVLDLLQAAKEALVPAGVGSE